MSERLYLGVEGGNTKTVALLARPDGTVVGAARGAGSDIYAYPDPADALAVLHRVVDQALNQAGASSDAVARGVFCLAGADWPEDVTLLEDGLRAPLPSTESEVRHDSQGHLWAGHPDGHGVAVAFGTALAIGAGHRDGGSWSSANWLPLSGAHGLGHDAVQAAFAAHLGFGDPTVLAEELPRFYGVDGVHELSHLLTCRNPHDRTTVRFPDLAPLVLDAVADGDSVASAILDRHVAGLARYVAAASALVGLEPGYAVTLGGGPTRHHDRAVLRRLAAAVGDSASVTLCRREPAVGTLVKALHDDLGSVGDDVLARLDATSPAHDFYATLADRSDASVA
ncbi:MAG: N-acetylglucosamine kinase [Nocardioidaceae bacterium]